MVRRGSTVRVRQRALLGRETARKLGVLVADLDIGSTSLERRGSSIVGQTGKP
jgi:hypothetical protein